MFHYNEKMRFTIVFLALLWALPTWARVFNLATETKAVYLKGNVGLSNLGEDAYINSSGSSTVFNAQPKYNYGGEVGIVFVGKDAGGNLGVEFFSAQKQSAISGTNSGGTELMTVDSNITAMIAKGGLIYNYKTIGNFRLYSGLTLGYALVQMQNDYTLNGVGQGMYGISSFNELGKSSAIMGDVTTGMEFPFADTGTMFLELGYRYFTVSNLQNEKAGTGFSGAVTTGTDVTNADGSKRTLDLGGVFTGIGFRFYLPH